jgi:ABC-2 type transport system ATP-binding protein
VGTAPPLLEATKLSRRFGRVVAVESLSLTVPRGTSIGLLGPNGAGKTTTFRMLAGTLSPSEGQIRVGGYDLREDAARARAHIGYMPENAPVYPELTTAEYLQFRAQISGRLGSGSDERRSIARAIEQTRTGSALHARLGTLSKGFRQRVMLAASLLGDPPLLLLDEPTAGLDPNQVLEVRELVREIARERTVILSTHILSEVEETCRDVLVIDGGRLLFSGSLEGLLREQTGRRGFAEVQADGTQLAQALAREPAPTQVVVSEVRPGVSRVTWAETPEHPVPAIVERLVGQGILVNACGLEARRLDRAFAALTLRAQAKETGP